MFERIGNCHLLQRFCGATPKWSTTCGQQQSSHLTLCITRRTQALMNRAVLTIDRNNHCSFDASQWLDNWTSCYQALFVCQRKSFSILQRGHRHRQTCKANYSVYNNVSISRQLCKVRHHFDTRQCLRNLLSSLFTMHSNHFRFVQLCLCNYFISVATDPKTNYFVLTTTTRNDIKSLRTNRASRTSNCNSHDRHMFSLSAKWVNQLQGWMTRVR